MSKKWFRFLVLLSWVLAAAGIAIFFVEKRTLPPELKSYLDSRADIPLTTRDYFAGLLVLFCVVLAAVNSVGLYRFRPWARVMYLWIFVAGYAMSSFIFTEPTVTPHLSGLLFSLNTAFSGFMLALLYFSPVAGYFKHEPSV